MSRARERGEFEIGKVYARSRVDSLIQGKQIDEIRGKSGDGDEMPTSTEEEDENVTPLKCCPTRQRVLAVGQARVCADVIALRQTSNSIDVEIDRAGKKPLVGGVYLPS